MSILLFDNFKIYYHYSSEKLQKGDIIISDQDKMKTYELVWNVYAETYFELFNKNFPKKYGYAYPEKKDMRLGEYKVIALNDVILGNYKYSLYVTMDRLGEFIDKSLPLKERLIKRKEKIKEQSISYFTLTEYSQYIECICDKFEVI